MSSTATTSTATEAKSDTPTSSLEQKNYHMPTGYYFLVLLSPLLLGLSFVILGLLIILTGVFLILAAPIFLIVGPFVIPRNVSPDDPRWGWKVVLDRNVTGLRDWVRMKVIGGDFLKRMQ